MRSFLNADSISGGGGGLSNQCQICSICFKEITFLIHFTGELEAQVWMTLSSVSYCASLFASLKLIAFIRNEPAERMDKGFLISDSSHCCVTGSFIQIKQKHLVFTVCYCEPGSNCQFRGPIQSAVPTNGWRKKTTNKNKTKQILPILTPSEYQQCRAMSKQRGTGSSELNAPC